MTSRILFFQSLLHLFFPYTCCGCGSDLITENILFCIHCQSSMPITMFEYFESNPIEKVFWGRVQVHAAAAHLYFTSGSLVQHSLHLLKYKGRKEIGFYYGRQMGESLKRSSRFSDCEIVVPLPLFAKREKKRGYNQASLIAIGISQILEIPVLDDVVLRIKRTETQTHKNRIERWANMESTFEIRDSMKISGKHVLLIDDVVTTGASLEACTQVLLACPGVSVSIACLAYTVSA